MSRCKANPCCSDPYNCEIPMPQDITGLVHLNERDPMTNNLKAERTLTADKVSEERLAQLIANAAGATDETWWLDDVADALTELQHLRSQSLSTQQPMGEVRVKALEWSGIIPGRIYADIYMIERLELDDWRLFLRSNSHGDWPTFLAGPFSLDEAKSAAQEDYRQRILSALHPNQESGE